jgi:hypothetical protein
MSHVILIWYQLAAPAAAAVALFFFSQQNTVGAAKVCSSSNFSLMPNTPWYGVAYSSKGAWAVRVREVRVLRLFSRRCPSLVAALESPRLAGITSLMATWRWLGLAAGHLSNGDVDIGVYFIKLQNGYSKADRTPVGYWITGNLRGTWKPQCRVQSAPTKVLSAVL